MSDLYAADVCDRLPEVRTIPFKDESVPDNAFNEIIKAGEDAIDCLVARLVDATPMADPRKSFTSRRFVVGDLASILLCRITGRPFEDQLPPEVRQDFPTRGVAAYFDYVEVRENRKALQANWKQWLAQRRPK